MSHEHVASIPHHEKKSNRKEAGIEEKIQSFLEKPTATKVALGVAAAAGGGLLAVALLGAAPAAIAGTAGYLAYRGMTGRKAS